MEERRRAPRIKDENEVTITVASGEKNLPEEKINDNHTKDISVCGAKIKTNILLPVDTLIELDFTSKDVHQQINILGKVKWGKVINENESYDLGVEFYPSKEMEKLEDYISWKLKSNESEFNKNTIPPIDSGDINIVKTKKLPPVKNKQWIGIAIISLGTIILIVVLLKIFGYIPELDRMLVPHIIIKVKLAPEIKATPVPEVKAIPAPEAKATPAPEAEITPATEAVQKTKVIGNSDSKKYHLSGMKYYNSVKAYHRVEFNSESDAINAGYNKAPQ
jgi:hypothetical protein